MDTTPITTVLIVDDDFDIRLLVRTAIELANEGLTVVGEAADGIEAIERWRELDGPPVPDVVILDNRMPGLTGIEVAERLLTERPDQKVILYSAFIDDAVRTAAADVGVTACVVKNDLHSLPTLIQRLRAA